MSSTFEDVTRRFHGDDCRCAFCCNESREEWLATGAAAPGAAPQEAPAAGTNPPDRRSSLDAARSLALPAWRWTAHHGEQAARATRHLAQLAAAGLSRVPRRAVILTGAGMLAAVALAAVVSGLQGGASQAIAPVLQAPAGVAAAVGGVHIDEVSGPVTISIAAPPAGEICTATVADRRRIAGEMAVSLLAVVDENPHQLVAAHLRDLPMCFRTLPAGERVELSRTFGDDAPRRYELATAALLAAVLDAAQRQRPGALLTVVGLPVEPEQAGISLDSAQRTNQRYQAVIDRLGPFVTARRLVVFGSTLDEKVLAGMGMREALRLREDRPIVFQANTTWRALLDDDGPGYDRYLAAGQRDAGPGSRRGFRAQDLPIEAILSDHAFDDQ
jgi:hypothetical protein